MDYIFVAIILLSKMKYYITHIIIYGACILAARADGSHANGSWGAQTYALGPEVQFSFEKLSEVAQKRAQQPYIRWDVQSVRGVLDALNYDEWGRIRFRADKAIKLAGKDSYPITLFHLGRFFQSPVAVHVVRNGVSMEILYQREYFDIPVGSPAEGLPGGLGFAGFRLQESCGSETWEANDWLAYLGASYFRAIGDSAQYGISARGIVVDSGEPWAEEFPGFTDFYVEQATSGCVTVYALLDGPSVSAAFKFENFRNDGVVQNVEARFFFRRKIRKLGLAALTSMYWFSGGDKSKYCDWRPEVHDSDGLLVCLKSGGAIWRPLLNPARAMTSVITPEPVSGFGLLQRNRDQRSYLDGVNYERRPSLWVEPRGEWSSGNIELIELPTDDEVHDNIVAYFRPKAAIDPGTALELRYTLYWRAKPPISSESANCIATRIGRAGEAGQVRPQGGAKFVIEYDGEVLSRIGSSERWAPHVAASSGRVVKPYLERVPSSTNWRLVFDFFPENESMADLSAGITLDGRFLSERWIYRWPADHR